MVSAKLGTRSQIAFKIRIAGYVKMMLMKVHKSLHFLKPRLINVLLTFLVLCLPLLREQYNYGEYVTWHRPIVVMIDNLRELKHPKILLITFLFLLLVYFIASLAVFAVSKFALPLLKKSK